LLSIAHRKASRTNIKFSQGTDNRDSTTVVLVRVGLLDSEGGGDGWGATNLEVRLETDTVNANTSSSEVGDEDGGVGGLCAGPFDVVVVVE